MKQLFQMYKLHIHNTKLLDALQQKLDKINKYELDNNGNYLLIFYVTCNHRNTLQNTSDQRII